MLDTSWYRFARYRPVRIFQLDKFQIPEAQIRTSFARDFLLTGFDILAKRYPLVRAMASRAGAQIFIEKNAHVMPDYLYGPRPSGKFLSISGFWQTSDHFLEVRNEIQPLLKPSFLLSTGACALLERFRASNAGFIHVRRGDFVSLGHPLLPLDYYKHAVQLIESRHGNKLEWLVFSDDPEWCRSELRFLSNPIFVNMKGPMADLEEFQLMRACRHGVIANSSFSWWAAALIENPDAMICAPKNRYGEMGGADIQKERVLPWWILVE